MAIRRVVTGHDEQGKSVVLSNGVVARDIAFQHVPGFTAALVWATQSGQGLPAGRHDAAADAASWVPEPDGSRLLVITFPPDKVMLADGFDPQAAGAEYGAVLPGLAEKFEQEHPGMHTTDSVDYGVVLDGEIVLELDDGREILCSQHDIVIQQGNRHAWRNRSDRPATVLFVLLGAQRLRHT